jgi:methylmalonyl-CoA mutase cobalamin-binding domain/chain
MRRVEERGIGDLMLLFGGTIPEQDVAILKTLAVNEVFPPGPNWKRLHPVHQRT